MGGISGSTNADDEKLLLAIRRAAKAGVTGEAMIGVRANPNPNPNPNVGPTELPRDPG